MAMPATTPTSSWHWAATASCCKRCTRSSDKGKPIYGMNFGSVGFLMNEYARGRPAGAPRPRPSPRASIPCAWRRIPGTGTQKALAFNEVSLLRQTRQTAKLQDRARRQGAARRAHLRRHSRLHAGRQHRVQPFRARADPAHRRGAARRSRRCRRSGRGAGAARSCRIMPRSASTFSSRHKRPVSATADDVEVRDVTRVDVAEDRSRLHDHAVRRRPQPGRAHPGGAVLLLIGSADPYRALTARRGYPCRSGATVRRLRRWPLGRGEWHTASTA